MREHRVSALIACTALVLACSNDKWEEPFPNRLGIIVTDSIGIEAGDPDYILGAIADAARSADGSILILDRSFQVIRKYQHNGIFDSILSSNGRGPGELSNALKMSVFDNGNMLIWDIGKQCISLLSPNGESIDEIVSSGMFPPLQPVALSDNRYAACDMTFEMDGNETVLILTLTTASIYSDDPPVALFRDTIQFNISEVMAHPSMTGLMGRVLMCSDLDDRIFYTLISNSSYAVNAFSGSGAYLFQAHLPLPPALKSQEELRLEEEYYTTQLGLRNLPTGVEVDPTYDMIAGIGVDEQGNLWVQRGTEPYPVFDVFDSSGNCIAAAEFPYEGRYWRFSISPYGALAWNDNPLDGVQKIYLIELPSLLD